MPEVITVGEILVEIMRKKVDVPLGKSAEFVGPFPSGAPAIFIDAVARLGKGAGIIGGVGRDEFGECTLSKLREDGVDVSKVKRVKEFSTGTAFVTYFSDGSRKFIFHVGNSAAGMIGVKDVPEDYVREASVIHISGSALTMCEEMREACYKAVRVADESKKLVSFDPNIRPEFLNLERQRRIMEPVFEKSDLLIPGSDELTAMTGAENEKEAAGNALEGSVKVVAVKKGKKGCRIYTDEEEVEAPAFDVREVDPTGAGDAFSAALVVGWLEGKDLKQLAVFANAVGAKAVGTKGPMEGVPRRNEVESML